MGFFGFGGDKGRISKVADLGTAADEASVLEALPVLARNAVVLAQEASIKFYRKIHSHEATSYPGVREEFFSLFLHALVKKLITAIGVQQGDRLHETMLKKLRTALEGMGDGFSSEAFWRACIKRDEVYRSLPGGADGAVADDVISLFSRYVCGHLEADVAHKVLHFGPLVVKEPLRRL